MSIEYNGVKFYGPNDLSVGWSLNQSVSVLESFDPTLEWYDDINKVLELYNVYLLFQNGARLKVWNNKTYNEYQNTVKKFPRVYSRYFKGICDNNFKKTIESVSVLYKDDFWTLFDELKAYKQVSGQVITDCVKSNTDELCNILKHKYVVKYYDNEITCILRTSDEFAELLIRESFWEKGNRLYFPDSFLSRDLEEILQTYVDSDHARPNSLSLIVTAKNLNRYPISDKLRLSAKRAYEKCLERQPLNLSWFEYGVSVTFKNTNEIKQLKFDDEHNCMSVVFDTKWIDDNLDYPTLLNNFIHVFEYFDNCWRSGFVSHKHRKASIADILMVRGKDYYNKSPEYDKLSKLYSMEMFGYCQQMHINGIYIGNIFKWFFEEYLPTEFGAKGFLFNTPTENATTLEKCKMLVSEMEGILKQFKLFVEDGCIDRELLEMSSNPFPISQFQSFIPNKYAYTDSNEIEQEMHLLFSDQSCMIFSRENSVDYDSFIDRLSSNELHVSDFEDFQQPFLEWLISRKALSINNDVVEMNTERITILKDLYNNDVICSSYVRNLQPQLDELICNGDLRYGSTLLSEPEQDYYNYVLNKAQFSNGLDLRNSYIHSTYPADESKQNNDYLEFLKMMVLIIGKINEEFILSEWLKNERE